MQKITTLDFIKKAQHIHGDKYDYSNTHYVGAEEKLEIKCNLCNTTFYQIASNHLQGKGCPKCARKRIMDKRKLSLSMFLEKAKKVHADKYDYSEVKYVNNHTKIKIFCKECQTYFYQTPNHHLNGANCPVCAKENRASKRRLSQLEFITKVKSIHGDKYSYNEINYITSSKRIKIFCKTCNEFFYQLASVHLQGSGCPSCANKKTSLRCRKKFSTFIKQAKFIHGDKYSYRESIYTGAEKKIKIFCKKCNKFFEQTPANHLNGKGCPYCNISKGEQQIEKLLIKYNIKYIRQKRFINCKYKNTLAFDFYLPDYNTCIEFQGEQHYKAINFFGGMPAFLKRQKRDKKKKQFCKKNNISLVEISYLEKDIETIIKSILH